MSLKQVILSLLGVIGTIIIIVTIGTIVTINHKEEKRDNLLLKIDSEVIINNDLKVAYFTGNEKLLNCSEQDWIEFNGNVLNKLYDKHIVDYAVIDFNSEYMLVFPNVITYGGYGKKIDKATIGKAVEGLEIGSDYVKISILEQDYKTAFLGIKK